MFIRPRRRNAPSRRAHGATSVPRGGLQVCTQCHADYVHPADWREADDTHWWMLLRCGECGARREVTVTDDVATRYGEDLDARQREIDRAVRRLDCERMAEQVEIFAAALERDLVDAGDFEKRGA
jgi:hypothetical protein